MAQSSDSIPGAKTTVDAPAPGTRAPISRESSLMPRYLELIRSGAKTVEGRIRTGKWADVIPDDRFRFFSTEDPSVSVICDVTFVHEYDSFRAMLEGEELQACLPGVGSLDEGVEVYRSIPGYREREGINGVVGVGIRVVEAVE